MSNKLTFYVISDSSGETNQTVLKAALAQFPQIKTAEVKRFPLVQDSQTLIEILQQAKIARAIIITTLVKKNLLHIVEDFAINHHLDHLDLLNNLLQLITKRSGFNGIEVPGPQHQLNDSYYLRMNAINFASKYDDGKNPKGFLKADLVIIGPSRTSKTPLSIYLANQGLQVANLPLVPEVTLPEELFKVQAQKMVGLVADPAYLQKVRTTRLHFLGLNTQSSYSDLNRIKDELAYAKKVMNEFGVKVFDITNQTIEETANKILEALPDLKKSV